MTLTGASSGEGLSEVALDARAHLLRVRGDASHAARDLRTAATAAVAAGRTVVIVDLSGATQVGGPLAWEITRAHERLLWRAGRVIVVFDSHLLGPLFDAFGLHRSPDVVPTLDAGLAAANVSAAGIAAARGPAAELASATPSGPPGTSAGELFAWRRNDDPPTSWSFELAGGRLAPRVARAAAGRVLAGWLDEAQIAELRLLVSEAVTNSVLHGGAGKAERLELTVTALGERVRVEVSDPAGGFEPLAYPADPLREHGRGLQLIHSLAHTWGVEGAPAGRLWFELACATA